MDDWQKAVKQAIDNEDITSLKELTVDGTDLRQNLETGMFHNKYTILHYAAAKHKPEIVRFLLEEKTVDPNIQDGSGFVPLYDLARSRGDKKYMLECFKLLIEAGADLDSVSNNSWKMSSLEAAVFSKNLVMIKALLEAGANPKPRTVKIEGKSGNLIHLAVSQCSHPIGYKDRKIDMDIIKTLVSKLSEEKFKGSINELMDGKYTPLDISDIEREKIFKGGKPDPNDKNDVHIQEIIGTLIEAGGTRNREKLPEIPLEDQVTLDDDLDEASRNALKEFACYLALVAHALETLIKLRKESGWVPEEYRRVAAYASKNLSDFVAKVEKFENKTWMSREVFNTIAALHSLESMMAPNYETTSWDENVLKDIKCDIHGILLTLNVYEHSY